MNETIVKHLNFGDNAKDKIFSGIEKLTKAVSSTLGASGRCVIMEDSNGNPQITKDGVTVANSVILIDPVENMGAKLIKEAARKTVIEAGDGTTTATVLAHAILKHAYKVLPNESPRKIKEGINLAVEKVVKYLEKNSLNINKDDIKKVATISANNDIQLGELIAEAFNNVGQDGLVIMETHDKPSTEVEVIEGIEYDQGYENSHFITDKTTRDAELQDPLVLIVDSPIENIRKIQSVLEHVITEKRSLLIIADVEPQVSNALAMNKAKGNIKVNIIKAPTYGVNRKTTLEDLSMLTGAKVVSEDLGDDLDLISLDYLGKCSKSTSTSTKTIIQVEEKSLEVLDLIDSLEERYSKSSGIIKDTLEKRISRLKGKVSIIRVGANSEVELKEKKDRVEDAICATKAAVKEGIVPGGGIALLNASVNTNPKSEGEKILLKAIKAPYETILSNAGLDIVYPQIKSRGLNVVTGKEVNMVKAGIIDPLLVTKCALKNAASVATTILSTDCVINNLRA
tara:strand:+ start:261 stop:1796 length:1536 start_codon:yes stop_codon:yes gene_type:complete